MPKSGTKNAWLGYFWQKMRYLGIFVQDFWKSYSHIWNQHPPICLITKLWKKEMPNFWTKNALFGCLWARILKKLLSYLKSAPTKCLFAKFHEKWKYLNLGQKWNDLCIFGLGLWKNIVIFEIQHPRISLTAKCCEKNCLILGQKCLIWVFLRTKFKKLLLYLKSIPSNLSNRKIFWRNKNG